MGDRIRSFRDLRVYEEAFRLQLEVFEVSKGFPKEELYSLTDQIRRSSRSVGANLAEAWHKRRYEAHFLSKLSDSDGEHPGEMRCAETSSISRGREARRQRTDVRGRRSVVGGQNGGMVGMTKDNVEDPACSLRGWNIVDPARCLRGWDKKS